MDKEVILLEEEVRKYWENGKPFNYKGKKYRIEGQPWKLRPE